MLVADPPPSKDGRVPGAGQGDLDRGLAYVQAEAFDKALPYLQRAIEADPQNAEAQYYLGLCLERAGERKKAEAAYKKALELDGKLTAARVNLGAIYLEEPVRPREAVEVLAPAAEQEPKAIDVHLNLAFAYRLDKRYDKSAEHYDKALALKDDPETRFAYADMLLEAGKTGPMVEQMRAALPGLEKQLDRLVVIAHRFAKAKAYEDCVKAFDMAVALKPEEPGFYLHRGLCKHGVNKEDAARSDYELALKKDPKFQPAHYYLAMSYLAAKKRTPAAEHFEKAVKLGKDTAVGKKAAEQLKKMAKQ